MAGFFDPKQVIGLLYGLLIDTSFFTPGNEGFDKGRMGGNRCEIFIFHSRSIMGFYRYYGKKKPHTPKNVRSLDNSPKA